MTRHSDTEHDDETSRYRRAAEATLAQLEWCADYLRSIRKPLLAEAIDKNRRFIQQEMKRADD